MRTRTLILATGMLAHLQACGPQPPAAPETSTPETSRPQTPGAELNPEPAGQASFDAEAWSRVVNASPCDWLPGALAQELIGSDAPGVLETSRSETACRWKNPDGTPLFTAAVLSFDSAANLAAERSAQERETENGTRFRRVGEAGSVVTPILRSDRIKLMMFPNSDNETAVIVLSGHPVMNEPGDVRGEKIQRAETFARELMRAHGL